MELWVKMKEKTQKRENGIKIGQREKRPNCMKEREEEGMRALLVGYPRDRTK
jgi:hypothetical protein